MHENDLECNSKFINKECFRKVLITHMFFGTDLLSFRGC